jgi:ankyrin
LQLAAKSRCKTVVHLLLEKGARVDAKARDGLTALHRAAASGDEALVQLLLEIGADVEAQSEFYAETALCRAVEYKQEAIV